MVWKWDNKNLSKAIGSKTDISFMAKNITIDSRKIKKGDIFVALKGENFDGNKFTAEALKKGAVACIVDDKKLKNEKFIKVDDCLEALQKMGKFRRDNSKAKFIAITGSVGKTGTKEILYKALSIKYKTYKTEGNFNNHIGLPLTLANMPDNIDIAVIEFGMNHKGEIAKLVNICRPDIAAITWISEAHIENLGSVKNIAKAKAEIFNAMMPKGSAVIPADNEFAKLLGEIAKNKGIKNIYSFGRKINSAVKNKNAVDIIISGKKLTITNELLEKQILNNVLLVLTIAAICKVDLKKALAAISEMEKIKGRGKKFIMKNGAVIIDDSYNASPTSMHRALDELNKQKATRKIAILGDMKELGKFSRKYHEEISGHLGKIDMLITCGKDMRYLYEKIKNKIVAKHFKEINQVKNFIEQEARKGDVILIKGSHGSNMYKLVDKLLVDS